MELGPEYVSLLERCPHFSDGVNSLSPLTGYRGGDDTRSSRLHGLPRRASHHWRGSDQ